MPINGYRAGTVIGLFAALAVASPSFGQEPVKPQAEVLHWWTSTSSKAIGELRKMFEARGGTWRDTPVVGENVSASATLKARILAGTAPEVSVVKGPEFQQWGQLGQLNDVQSTATAQGWDSLIAPALQPVMKYQGKYVGVPVDIHRNNWLFASPVALQKVGEPVPRTWDDFNRVTAKLQAAGIVPIAAGGEKWQEATMLETVAAGEGADWYRKAFVDLDPAALKDPRLVQVFTQLREMNKYHDAGYPGRNYERNMVMVANGEAGFDLMGDFTLAAMMSSGKEYGRDYVCVPAPSFGPPPPFVYNVDSFGFFKTSNPSSKAGQQLIAELTLSKQFQILFNRVKGSIPARSDIDLKAEGFSPCQIASEADYVQGTRDNTLIPSWAHSMAVSPNERGAMLDAASQFINSTMSPADGAKLLINAIDQARE